MPATESFGLRQMIDIYKRGLKPLALFIGSAMVSSLLLTYVYSERYSATTTILYRPNDAVRFGPQNNQTALGFPVPLLPFEVLGQTISHVGTSERILRPVVEDLGLDRPDARRRTGLAKYWHRTKEGVKDACGKAWQVLKHGRIIAEDPTSKAIVELAANTKIDTTRKEYVATLTVSDKDPVRAARIVDRIGTELVAFMEALSAGSAKQQGKDLDAQLAGKKREIDQVRAAVEELRASEGFINLEEATSLSLKTAEDLEQELLKNEADLYAARAKLASIVGQRKALEPMQRASETTADDPVYNSLRGTRASDEVDLSGLLQRYPEDHPTVRGARARIRTADALLASTEPTRVSESTRALNEVHQSLQGDELRCVAEVAGLEAAIGRIKRGLEKARGRVTRPKVVTRYNDLNLQLSVLESDYQKLATLREGVLAVELTSKPEVHVLHAATPQDAPVRPIKVYHVLLSGLIALALGSGFVYSYDFAVSQLGDADAACIRANT
jgi:uncharacterized protein involved in exopolysaccharide biosynthesis